VAENEILTTEEVANYLKVSRTTIWRWCNEGRLPAFKIGRGWRVRRGEVERMIDQNPGQPEDSAQPKGETTEEKLFPVLM
jgi:excisionase family DNA binding protein